MEALPDRFDKIEILAETELNRALKMMVDIYPEAANSYHHDIADAINIWIMEKGDKNIADYIVNKLPLIAEDGNIKVVLREWANKLSSKSQMEGSVG